MATSSCRQPNPPCSAQASFDGLNTPLGTHTHEFCEAKLMQGTSAHPTAQYCLHQRAVLLYPFLLRQGECSLSADAEAFGVVGLQYTESKVKCWH